MRHREGATSLEDSPTEMARIVPLGPHLATMGAAPTLPGPTPC